MQPIILSTPHSVLRTQSSHPPHRSMPSNPCSSVSIRGSPSLASGFRRLALSPWPSASPVVSCSSLPPADPQLLLCVSAPLRLGAEDPATQRNFRCADLFPSQLPEARGCVMQSQKSISIRVIPRPSRLLILRFPVLSLELISWLMARNRQ